MDKRLPKFSRVLLVDDDQVSVFLHRALLEQIGLAGQVDSVSNGLEALQYLAARHTATGAGRQPFSPPFLLPDLILLDIGMPLVNGLEFLLFCRSMELLPDRTLKVILLTAYDNPRSGQQAEAYGVDGYLTKPLTEEKLRGVIERAGW